MSEDIHPQTGQPVGTPVDDRPAERPGPVTLAGRYGRVEKLEAKHAGSLWAAVKGHDAIWTYMSQYGPFADAAEFPAWVAQRAARMILTLTRSSIATTARLALPR